MWVDVPVTTKKGEDLDTHLLNLSNVLYFREWFESAPVTKDKPGKCVAYVIGGKEVVIDMPLHRLYEVIANKGFEIRNTKMLERDKENDKEKA